MKNNNRVRIEIEHEIIYLNQNEFWYFKNRLVEIDHYYKYHLHRSQSILVKIPGTKTFKKINYNIYKSVANQINKIISNFKNDLLL